MVPAHAASLGHTTARLSAPSFVDQDGPPQGPTPDGRILSTDMLFEGAAVAHELMFLQASGAAATSVEDRIWNVLDTPYASALVLFLL